LEISSAKLQTLGDYGHAMAIGIILSPIVFLVNAILYNIRQ
jgi:hypothetical protein